MKNGFHCSRLASIYRPNDIVAFHYGLLATMDVFTWTISSQCSARNMIVSFEIQILNAYLQRITQNTTAVIAATASTAAQVVFCLFIFTIYFSLWCDSSGQCSFRSANTFQTLVRVFYWIFKYWRNDNWLQPIWIGIHLHWVYNLRIYLSKNNNNKCKTQSSQSSLVSEWSRYMNEHFIIYSDSDKILSEKQSSHLICFL